MKLILVGMSRDFIDFEKIHRTLWYRNKLKR